MLFVVETVMHCHPRMLKGCFHAYIGYTGYNLKKLKNAKNGESVMDAGSERCSSFLPRCSDRECERLP